MELFYFFFEKVTKRELPLFGLLGATPPNPHLAPLSVLIVGWASPNQKLVHWFPPLIGSSIRILDLHHIPSGCVEISEISLEADQLSVPRLLLSSSPIPSPSGMGGGFGDKPSAYRYIAPKTPVVSSPRPLSPFGG